jgi:hypothetical protein
MLRPPDRARVARLQDELAEFNARVRSLPGIRLPGHLSCLVEQMIESLRRIEFIYRVRDGRHDARRMDPASALFDPLKAAILQYRQGNVDEAYWLVFLAVHFGKHGEDGWQLARDVYGRLRGPGLWDWAHMTADSSAFRNWLAANEAALKGDGVSRRFNNHRKYESLRAASENGTAAVFESYVAWVSPPRTHQEMIREAHRVVGQNPRDTFHYLYRSMATVRRFGRLARFDYLAMLGKLGIAPVDPASAYLGESTGPLRGARLLFGGSTDAKLRGSVLDAYLLELDDRLRVGMQTLEDALCNWQKSPAQFLPFRG